jgi:predicted phosphodiesterase
MPLRILHLSDIHFHIADWDADGDVHRELISDVASLVTEEGALDAVLIGGDIAFSGAAAEYLKATNWIQEVRFAAGGLDESRVWMVPGNHDVDWAVVGQSLTAKQFRDDIASRSGETVDHTLGAWIRDPCSDGLIKPLDAYNDFARPYSCAIRFKQPHWNDRSLTVDGQAVQLTGLNSVLMSGGRASDDHLVVGTFQAQLSRTPPAIRIAMIHHPPSWLRDWDVVEPFMRRAHVLLFGHEHAFAPRQRTPGGTVEISAGAVTPEREAGIPTPPYVPSYNVVTLSFDEVLRVRVHPRLWNNPRSRFELHPDGLSEFEVALDPAVDDLLGAAEPAAEPIDASPLVEERSPASGNIDEATEVAALRLLAVQFMNLQTSDKVFIAGELDVLDSPDDLRPLDEVFPEVLERIRDRGLIPKLRELMGAHGRV